MNKHLAQVKEFHEKFDHPIAKKPTVKISDKLKKLRVKLIQEELDELWDALNNEDLVEVADALADIQYVLDGTYLVCGLHNYAEALSDEVHRSNMSKLGKNGQPIRRKDGKILKGPDYSKPNIKKVLKNGVDSKAK